AQKQGGGRGYEGAAGFDDELGLALFAKVVADRRRDGFEIIVHRRRFTGRVGGWVAAADIEALELDVGLLDDAGGSGDVALVGVSVFALAADVEAQAGGIAHLV